MTSPLSVQTKAKQFVAVNHEGYVIGDEILFGLDDDHFSLVGVPITRLADLHCRDEHYDVELQHGRDGT